MFKKSIIILTIFSLNSFLKCPNTEKEEKEDENNKCKYLNIILDIVEDTPDFKNSDVQNKGIIEEAMKMFRNNNPKHNLNENQIKKLKDNGLNFLTNLK